MKELNGFNKEDLRRPTEAEEVYFSKNLAFDLRADNSGILWFDYREFDFFGQKMFVIGRITNLFVGLLPEIKVYLSNWSFYLDIDIEGARLGDDEKNLNYSDAQIEYFRYVKKEIKKVLSCGIGEIDTEYVMRMRESS